MHKQARTNICSVSSLILLAAMLSTTPEWSFAGDKKNEFNKATDIGAKEITPLKDGGNGKKSVKKKAAKKAGTTVAVGVAGAKVKSGVKGKVKRDKE